MCSRFGLGLLTCDVEGACGIVRVSDQRERERERRERKRERERERERERLYNISTNPMYAFSN